MSDTTSTPGLNLSASNVAGSPASSFAGLAAMVPAILATVGTLQVPNTLAEWAQIIFGILALFAKA